MPSNNTDRDWESLAHEDPYWSVLTQDRFRKKVLDETGRREFFLSGEKYIDWVFLMIRNHIDPQFNPAKGLDFGCGVGRLLLPIARRCQSAVGIDISETMLCEAEKNCHVEKVTNISLVEGDDSCSGLTPGFDFINSFIVFQHIPCDRGVRLFRRLIELLNEGGVGAVHFTYSRSGFQVDADVLNYAPGTNGSSLGGRHHLAGIKRVMQNRLSRIFQRKASSSGNGSGSPKSSAPVMQMNSYLLNPLLQILQQAGVREMHMTLSDHGGALGAVLFFRKGTGSYPFPDLSE
jgi:SAM-dependent methyltransferase